MIHPRAVSYTHLDVYKRQDLREAKPESVPGKTVIRSSRNAKDLRNDVLAEQRKTGKMCIRDRIEEAHSFYGYGRQYIYGDITVMVSPEHEKGILDDTFLADRT